MPWSHPQERLGSIRIISDSASKRVELVQQVDAADAQSARARNANSQSRRTNHSTMKFQELPFMVQLLLETIKG